VAVDPVLQRAHVVFHAPVEFGPDALFLLLTLLGEEEGRQHDTAQTCNPGGQVRTK